jgi:hypothetical protein
MKVILIFFTSLKKNYPSWHYKKGQSIFIFGCPLIFQNIRLPELAPFLAERLLRLRRAGPSASLDKSADWGY